MPYTLTVVLIPFGFLGIIILAWFALDVLFKRLYPCQFDFSHDDVEFYAVGYCRCCRCGAHWKANIVSGETGESVYWERFQ